MTGFKYDPDAPLTPGCLVEINTGKNAIGYFYYARENKEARTIDVSPWRSSGEASIPGMFTIHLDDILSVGVMVPL